MIPDGELLRSRVVVDLSAALEDALDRRLDGYAVISPRGAMLEEEGRGILTFEDGVPTLAYHAGTDRGGSSALADIGAGPYRVELYRLAAEDLDVPHAVETLRVPPGMAAERLAGDSELAARTRRLAGDRGGSEPDALESFLENEVAVAELKNGARAEARRRAEEWGFDDAV